MALLVMLLAVRHASLLHLPQIMYRLLLEVLIRLHLEFLESVQEVVLGLRLRAVLGLVIEMSSHY
jgi:hypothetical protein